MSVFFGSLTIQVQIHCQTYISCQLLTIYCFQNYLSHQYLLLLNKNNRRLPRSIFYRLFKINIIIKQVILFINCSRNNKLHHLQATNMTVYKTNSLVITLNPESKQIWIECLESLDTESFKTGLLKALDLAKLHGVRQWLIDARRIGELSDAEECWVQINFFPQLMDSETTCYMAMVISNNCYDRMLQENGWFGLKSYNTFIKINTFYSLQDAENWLHSHTSDSEYR